MNPKIEKKFINLFFLFHMSTFMDIYIYNRWQSILYKNWFTLLTFFFIVNMIIIILWFYFRINNLKLNLQSRAFCEQEVHKHVLIRQSIIYSWVYSFISCISDHNKRSVKVIVINKIKRVLQNPNLFLLFPIHLLIYILCMLRQTPCIPILLWWAYCSTSGNCSDCGNIRKEPNMQEKISSIYFNREETKK